MQIYSTRTFNYWKKKGIKHDAPLPLFGTNCKQFMQKASMTMMANETYWRYPNERVVGFYRGLAPELVMRDPKLVKQILIADFNYFYSRGFLPNKFYIEPLLRNLFFADGDLWKLLRQRFSPVFSIGKIKAMFPLITERAEKLQLVAEKVSTLDSYDIRELMSRYTTDFIGACCFGLNMDTLNDGRSEFLKIGKRIFSKPPGDALRGSLKVISPKLFKYLHFLPPSLETSVNNLVISVMQQRNYKPSGRNDFIDLMLELKQNGNLVGESIEQKYFDGSTKIVQIEFNYALLIAQVFVFFAAGFETSSTSSSYTLHQLAYHPEIQRKVQEEIDTVLEKYDNKVTYDAVNDMKYLEKCFYESLRKWPPIGYIMRECAKKYTFPEINLTIDKGIKVIIPITAMMNDEKYFAEPEKFDPDRFKSMKDMKNNVFIPFGDGPRACVGGRLGLMQSMAGIAAVLQKFDVEPSSESVPNPKADPTGTVAENFAGGLHLKLRKRKCKNIY
ncbi:unnamed protein product [Leptidea sinapis]|uniref:unspecific monooxygenase n=1 Tax=Leptidea sinapis TaxID=189913 RepID=A0A5E4QH57_9NEOP|nr:unnamed protein product [Leptidea sinapis]